MSFLTDGILGWLGANAQSKAAEKGAKASRDATTQQIKYLTETRDQIRADQEPWRLAGVGALGRLQNPLASFEASPDYQYRLAEGMKGVNQNFATAGLLKSGAALRGINDYAQNTAKNEFGDWWNRQSGLAGVGQSANNANAQAGQFFAGQAGGALQQNALNLASSYQNQGNAWAGFYGGLAGSLRSTGNALLGYGG